MLANWYQKNLEPKRKIRTLRGGGPLHLALLFCCQFLRFPVASWLGVTSKPNNRECSDFDAFHGPKVGLYKLQSGVVNFRSSLIAVPRFACFSFNVNVKFHFHAFHFSFVYGQ